MELSDPLEYTCVGNRSKIININEKFNGLPIRIFGTAEEPLFCGVDVADILDLTNLKMTIKKFDLTEIAHPHMIEKANVRVYDRLGRLVKNPIMLTEFGVHRLMSRRETPIAKQFKHWIYEKLRDIRLREPVQLETHGANTESKELKKEAEYLDNLKKQVKERTFEVIFIMEKEVNPKLINPKECLPKYDRRDDSMDSISDYSDDNSARSKVSEHCVCDFCGAKIFLNVPIKLNKTKIIASFAGAPKTEKYASQNAKITLLITGDASKRVFQRKPNNKKKCIK